MRKPGTFDLYEMKSGHRFTVYGAIDACRSTWYLLHQALAAEVRRDSSPMDAHQIDQGETAETGDKPETAKVNHGGCSVSFVSIGTGATISETRHIDPQLLGSGSWCY